MVIFRGPKSNLDVKNACFKHMCFSFLLLLKESSFSHVKNNPLLLFRNIVSVANSCSNSTNVKVVCRIRKGDLWKDTHDSKNLNLTDWYNKKTLFDHKRQSRSEGQKKMHAS